MDRRNFLKAIGVWGVSMGLPVFFGCAEKLGGKQKQLKRSIKKPNIVFILADDLGYGDVSCLNENGKIKTSNIDSIARAGMKFTDAHSGAWRLG